MGDEKGRCLQITAGGGGEGERAGVLIDAEAHDGRLVRGDTDVSLPDDLHQQGRVGTGQFIELEIPLDIIFGRGMVVVDMDLKIIVGQDVGHSADAATLAGIDEDELPDAIKVKILQIGHVEEVNHRFDEKIAQVSLLGTGENDHRLRVELLRGQHRGHGVEIRVDVGGDDGLTARK